MRSNIKLYNREHYRWLCPSRPETIQYLKERVAELAQITAPGGRPSGFHTLSRRHPALRIARIPQRSTGPGVSAVDFCYCDTCRACFKALTADPLDLEDPTADERWMQYRWDALSAVTSEVCAEIKNTGKLAFGGRICNSPGVPQAGTAGLGPAFAT